ncbi:hypothetical protein V2G26_010983 [Clonostachys chloroleuca]
MGSPPMWLVGIKLGLDVGNGSPADRSACNTPLTWTTMPRPIGTSSSEPSPMKTTWRSTTACVVCAGSKLDLVMSPSHLSDAVGGFGGNMIMMHGWREQSMFVRTVRLWRDSNGYPIFEEFEGLNNQNLSMWPDFWDAMAAAGSFDANSMAESTP